MLIEETIDPVTGQDFLLLSVDTAMADAQRHVQSGLVIVICDWLSRPVGILTEDAFDQPCEPAEPIATYENRLHGVTRTVQGAPLLDILRGVAFDKTIRWHVVVAGASIVGVIRPSVLLRRFGEVNKLLASQDAAPDAPPTPHIEASGARITYLCYTGQSHRLEPPAVHRDDDGYARCPFHGTRMVAESPAPALGSNETDERVINAWIEGLPKDAVLQQDIRYQLNFNVASPHADAHAIAGGIGRVIQQLAAHEEWADILIVLTSDDVVIHGDDQRVIRVPRIGPSHDTAVFTIEPTHQGSAEIKALFFANNRLFQKMIITLRIGAPVAEAHLAIQHRGLTLDSMLVRPYHGRVISLTIIERVAGYEFLVRYGGVIRATVRLKPAQIADLVLHARAVVRGIVYTMRGGEYVYQRSDMSIPSDVYAETLRAMADLGVYLYESIFYAPGNSSDARAMGDLLRQLLQQQELTIQIVAEQFVFPWMWLYDRVPLDDGAIDLEGFWGFKHILEYAPEFVEATPVQLNPEILLDSTMDVAFICNTTIDETLRQRGSPPVVDRQRAFLVALPGVSMHEYPTGRDLYALLNSRENSAQLLYFYCHAKSTLPGETGGVDSSFVQLSDGPISLRDLKRRARLSADSLRDAPLVFLNACESAELSPYLYDGLVPYFIAKGARGVIGTEVDVPALFAAEFAQTLITRFVAGDQPIGDLLLSLRQEYLIQHKNVLGLIYALYSSADLVVRRRTLRSGNAAFGATCPQQPEF